MRKQEFNQQLINQVTKNNSITVTLKNLMLANGCYEQEGNIVRISVGSTKIS
jgi:hypothetical protein